MLIGLTGRIAAGKETLTQFLRDKGFIYLETSKVLKDELIKRGKEITRTNMQDLGDELRAKHGSGALMKLLLEKTDKNNNYIFDSLRNAGEADFLRGNVKDFVLIGVDAPQKSRFERIISRGKSSDPKKWEEFLEADNRDFFDEKNPLGQQVGKVMEKADFIIMNDGNLENSMKKIEEIWREIDKKNNKKERVSIFIDGSNLYHSLKRYSIKIKFEDLINKLESKRKIINIFYYTTLLDKNLNEIKYNEHMKFLEKMKKIPKFNIILCNLRKIILKDGSFHFEIKGDDVYLATDLIKGAYEDLYDVAIIVSGDEDFIPAINLVQKNNKKVINAFFPKSSSYLLRNCCDASINLKRIL